MAPPECAYASLALFLAGFCFMNEARGLGVEKQANQARSTQI